MLEVFFPIKFIFQRKMMCWSFITNLSQKTIAKIFKLSETCPIGIYQNNSFFQPLGQTVFYGKEKLIHGLASWTESYCDYVLTLSGIPGSQGKKGNAMGCTDLIPWSLFFKEGA